MRHLRTLLMGVLVVAVSFSAGFFVNECHSSHYDNQSSNSRCDTIIFVDTLPYISPEPLFSSEIGYKEITVPVPNESGTGCISDMRGDSLCTPQTSPVSGNDSMTLRLPVVQNIYEDSTYKAYVSGVYPSLDSIFVYPRREIVTIRNPPKHWHVGPVVGIGYTPRGIQPYIGVSVMYSIISF